MKKMISTVLVFTLLGSLAGCGGTGGASASAGSASAGSAAAGSGAASSAPAVEPVTITVGTRGTLLPFTYVDDAGNLTGFDVEVVRQLDERIPEIEVEFQTMELAACFAALDAGQIDMVANQLGHNDERDNKYTFTEIPYAYSNSYMTVRGDVDDIVTFEDLKGKTFAIAPNQFAASLVEEFNETADPKINVKYFEGGNSETLLEVAAGRADATVGMKPSVQTAVESNGYDLKCVGDPVVSAPVFFILRQDEQGKELAAQLDAALQTMIDDGTLAELSEQFLGEDITKPVE